MGVHGLTAFLKENRRTLSYTLELNGEYATNDGGDDLSITIVVDGWSFIYATFSNSGEPWVYGGEYAALGMHVEAIVSAWISVGIKPTFVFDGPTPLLKYHTVISRLQDNCAKPANLFFRTSPAARSTSRSLAETRIAPPLGYQSIVSTLLDMGSNVQVEFADGEADPYIVALAARLGAYVVGNDSDFLVLYCEGYKGYIPLEEMTWIATPNDEDVYSPDSSAVGDDDGIEFQVVTKKKQKGKFKTGKSRIELGTGILPRLPVNSDVTLLLTIYNSTTFADHCSLPPSLLPLLGALIGNDYASFDFFRSKERAVERVKRVAATLSSVLKEAQSGNTKKIRKITRSGEGGVMDVIGTTVERLLVWRDPINLPTSGQIDDITDKVVQSTLEYTLNDSTSFQGGDLGDAAEQVRQAYLDAYRRGTLHPRLMEVFTRGSCFPRLFLEDPDRECCARSIGRPVREVIWSVLCEGGGIPERPEPWIEDSRQVPEVPTDEDELVDVVEEFSDDEVSMTDNDDDPLAALRGKLQRLSFSGIEETQEIPDPIEISLSEPEPESQTSNSFVEVVKPVLPKMVTDYTRRGARVVGEDLEVRQLHHFMPEDSRSDIPVQLKPTEERLRVFLQALGSDTHAIRELAAEDTRSVERGGMLLAVVTLRWVLKTLHARAEAVEDGSRRRERSNEKWTHSEAQAFLWSLYDENPAENPLIEDRAVQLTAQVLAGFEACGWLAQVLLLVDLPGVRKTVREEGNPSIVMGEAEKLFSGRRFHSALHNPRLRPTKPLPPLWSAVEEGLEDVFGEERDKRAKTQRKGRYDTSAPSGAKITKTPAGMFGVLALDIE